VRFGKLDDLEKTITIGQKVVEMTTADDTDFPSRLNDLAIAYSRRFAHLGCMNDISEAIRRHQQVIRLTPDDILIFQRFFLECGSWSLHLRNDENVGTSWVSGTNKGQISRFCIGPPLEFESSKLESVGILSSDWSRRVRTGKNSDRMLPVPCIPPFR